MYGEYEIIDETGRLPLDPDGGRREARRIFSRVALSVVVLLAVRELTGLGLDYLLYRLLPEVRASWAGTWILSFVPMYLFGLPAMLLSLRGVGKAPMNGTFLRRGAEQPKGRFSPGWFFVILLVALGWMEGGNLIGVGLMGLLSRLVGYDYTNALTTVVDSSPLYMVFLGTVVLAPIGEEFIFRKLLIDRTRRCGDIAAILISALFFSLFHGNLFQLFYTFLLGLLLSYLYTRTGNVFWSMGLHAFINFYGGVLPTLINRSVDFERLTTEEPGGFMAYFLENPFGVAGYLLYGLSNYTFIFVSIILTICLCTKVRLGRGELTPEKGRRFSTVVVNVGMITALVLFAAVLVLSLIPPRVG